MTNHTTNQTDRHGVAVMERTPGEEFLGTSHARGARGRAMTEALIGIDRDLRAKSRCEHCGMPRKGLCWTIGGRMRGTGRDGESRLTGYRTETPRQAGLCTCVEVQASFPGEDKPAVEVYPDEATAREAVNAELDEAGCEDIPQGWRALTIGEIRIEMVALNGKVSLP